MFGSACFPMPSGKVYFKSSSGLLMMMIMMISGFLIPTLFCWIQVMHLTTITFLKVEMS